MITTIFIFLATAIAIVIYTIYAFRFFALFILLLLAFIIYIKVKRDIRKYGSDSIFRAFHKYPTDNEQLKLVKNILKNKIKIQTLLELDSEILVAIDESGILLIKILEAVGRIIPNSEESSFLVKNETTTVIPNFFQELDSIEKEIQSQINNIRIKKIIVKKGTCRIEIPYSKEYLVAGMHNFYYELQRFTKEKKYTKEMIEKCSIHLSKNVKLKENTCTK